MVFPDCQDLKTPSKICLYPQICAAPDSNQGRFLSQWVVFNAVLEFNAQVVKISKHEDSVMDRMSASTHPLQDSGEERKRTEELEDRRCTCERLASAPGGAVTAAALPIQNFHKTKGDKNPSIRGVASNVPPLAEELLVIDG